MGKRQAASVQALSFFPVQGGGGVKAFGIAGAELFDVHGEDSLQVIADGVSGLGQVPGHVAQLFGEGFPVQRMALGKVLLDQVDGFAGLTAESHHAVDEHVFFGKRRIQRPQRQLLIFIDGQVHLFTYKETGYAWYRFLRTGLCLHKEPCLQTGKMPYMI